MILELLLAILQATGHLHVLGSSCPLHYLKKHDFLNSTITFNNFEWFAQTLSGNFVNSGNTTNRKLSKN